MTWNTSTNLREELELMLESVSHFSAFDSWEPQPRILPPLKLTEAKCILIILLTSIFPVCLGSLVGEVFVNANIPFLDSIAGIGPTTTPNKLAKRQNLNYVSYSITIDGRGQGNWEDFLVSGTLLATDGISAPGTSNGPNAADIYLSVGSPAANPVAGSIRYFSNRGIYSLAGGTNAQSLIDYATVTVSGQTTTFIIDSTLAAANALSELNARSGILANVYLIASGSFMFTVTPEGVLSGSIEVTGQGFIEPGTAPYKAVVSGQAIGKGTLNV